MPALKKSRGAKPARAKPARARARRRAAPQWLRPALRYGIPAVLIAAAGAPVLWVTATGAWKPALAAAEREVFEFSARAGLRVAHMVVIGRRQVSRAAIERALGIRRGTAILAFDPHAAKARLEKLSWVRAATVERRLPDTVYVRLTEHRPLALWQYRKRFALIGRDGAVITRTRLDRWRHLPLVVGKGAETAAARVLEALAGRPGVARNTRALVRVSDRRWNLKLTGGVIARLPEDGTARALATLERLITREGILKRAVVAIDLRFPGRLVVRLAPRPPKDGRNTGPARASKGPHKET